MSIYPQARWLPGWFKVCAAVLVVAGYALAQFAASYACIAQIGLYIEQGHGQFVVKLADLLARF